MGKKAKFTTFIQFKVTPKDKELLEKTAEDKSKTVSEVLRELIKTLEESD